MDCECAAAFQFSERESSHRVIDVTSVVTTKRANPTPPMTAEVKLTALNDETT